LRKDRRRRTEHRPALIFEYDGALLQWIQGSFDTPELRRIYAHDVHLRAPPPALVSKNSVLASKNSLLAAPKPRILY